MSQDRPVIRKSHWTVGVGLKVVWGRVSGTHQCRVNSVSQVDGDSGDPTASFLGGKE